MSNLERLGRIPEEGEGHIDEGETKGMEEKEMELTRTRCNLLGTYITQAGERAQGGEGQVSAILSHGP